MKLFTPTQYQQLLLNGQTENCKKDHLPVVKWFRPDTGATWLLTKIDPDNLDIAFGLYDLGRGFPKLGNVYLCKITTLRGRLGLTLRGRLESRMQRDLHFEATHPLSVYARAARCAKHIVTDRNQLDQAAAILNDRR